MIHALILYYRFRRYQNRPSKLARALSYWCMDGGSIHTDVCKLREEIKC